MRSHIDLSRSAGSVRITCWVASDGPLPAAAYGVLQGLAGAIEEAMSDLSDIYTDIEDEAEEEQDPDPSGDTTGGER